MDKIKIIPIVALILFLGLLAYFKNESDQKDKAIQQAENIKRGNEYAKYAKNQTAKAQQQSPCSYPHVPKKSGIYDSRKNDLWELANDWVFFRGEILKRAAQGDSAGAQKARESFQQTNAWLTEYSENQVSEALALAEKFRSGK